MDFHQQYLGFHRQRACNADTLLHSAGDFIRALVERVLTLVGEHVFLTVADQAASLGRIWRL